MIGLNLPYKGADQMNVLCLGAHSDDIEIGCGGTLLYLKRNLPRLKFHWVVFSTSGIRAQEAAKAVELFTADREREVVLESYRDGFLPYCGGDLKDAFEALKGKVNPDLIFTHWRNDAHQDHRLVSELTWNTFRNHLILEYEIPKYDGDLSQPNLFVPLEAKLCEQKVDYLFEAFESQSAKRWFDRQTFLGLMRIRGMESNSSSGYAEAFYCRKVTVK
jgi:LmbE family N-acetylglucosaminyl deacetylase